MKKFSDNKKGSKGFYAALGISAVMIGSACYFAYDQGEKLTNDFTAQQIQPKHEEAVDRRVNDLPKGTSPAYRITTPNVTATPKPASTAPPAVTLPAEAIIVDPAEPVDDIITPDDAEPVANTKLENIKPPLNDISDVINIFSGGELVKNLTTGSWQTHNGTDISAEVGADVYAVSNGEITEIVNDAVWGVTAVLDHHNGYVTRYCGLSDGLSVQEGDMLVSGDLIGTVGDTADIESALSPHLHIELLHNGRYIDPMSEITK